MPIKEFCVFNDTIEYDGPFELNELYTLMTNFFKNHHYDKFEKRHYEKRTEEGRYIELDLEPNKHISDFMKLRLGMLIFIRDLKDVKLKSGKVVQQAHVSIRFRSFVEKKYGEFWERRPLYFFLRTWTDKFIYDRHLGKFTDELTNDTEMLKEQIKHFLNLSQHR